MNEPDALRCAAFLIAAFVGAGILHVLWMGSPSSRYFAVPLDFGRTIRGRRLFGDNKTFRGFVVMTPAAAAAFVLLSKVFGGLWPISAPQYAALGVCSGLGFMLGELPNSFLKRQLGVPPGQAPTNPTARLVCLLIDRTDSIAGMLVALRLLVPVPWQTWIYVLVSGAGIHGIFSFLLYRLGVKGRAL